MTAFSESVLDSPLVLDFTRHKKFALWTVSTTVGLRLRFDGFKGFGLLSPCCGAQVLTSVSRANAWCCNLCWEPLSVDFGEGEELQVQLQEFTPQICERWLSCSPAATEIDPLTLALASSILVDELKLRADEMLETGARIA